MVPELKPPYSLEHLQAGTRGFKLLHEGVPAVHGAGHEKALADVDLSDTPVYLFDDKEQHFRPLKAEKAHKPKADEEEIVPKRDLELMTIAELREFAAQHEIDLGDATHKADIVKVIVKAEKK